MAYNITITVKNSKDIKKLANLVAELVEQATGQRAILRIHDRSKALGKQEQEKLAIQRKLLK